MDNDKRSFLYCNQVQIATSPWDVLFTFQRIAMELKKDGVATGTPSMNDEFQVAMSPAHAKVMLAALHTQIEGYEQFVNAKIPLDKDNQEKYDSFIKKIKSSS